jgi:hypothetical protein
MDSIEVPIALEEAFPEHLLANLLFVYLQSDDKGFLWEHADKELQDIFFANLNIDMDWEYFCSIFEDNIPLDSAAYKELMSYFQLNREVFNEAIKNRKEEEITMAKQCLNSIIAKKQFGEVFTPLPLVDEMLDKLPTDLWSNPNLKWIDPSCGSGNFLIRVFDRLMNGLIEVIPDEEDRRKHILEQMIYGVELQPKNVIISMMFLDPDNKYKLNLACADALKFDYWNEMKFDVVVGNPPYQEIDKNWRSKGAGKNLWSRFVYKANELLRQNGYLSFIHPSSWMSPSSSSSKDENILTDIFLKYNMFYLEVETAKRFFPKVGSTFSWYVIQKSTEKQNNLQTIVTCDYNQQRYVSNIILEDIQFLPTLICKESLSIMKKTVFSNNDKMTFIRICSLHSQNSKKNLSKIKDEIFSYKVRHTGAQILWTNTPVSSIHNQKKVTVSGPGYLSPLYDDGECSTTEHSLSVVVSDKIEGDIIIRLLESKLYRFILQICKWSGFNHPKVLNSLPRPKDLTSCFTDKDIYDYFGLTEEEISLIESTVN